jgi:hypothetical protein
VVNLKKEGFKIMKNYQTKICFLFLAFILPNFLFSANIKLELQNADVDQNKNYIVYINESARLNIEISDDGNNLDRIQIPGLEKFQIVGQRNSRQTSIINGRSSSKITYMYEIVPQQEGIFAIGPAQASGQKVESNTLKITVKTKSSNSSGQGQSNHKRAEGHESSGEGEAEVICKIFTNKKTVCEREPFIVTVATYARGPILQCGQTPPNFPGFISKEIKEERRKPLTLNDKQFVCVEKDYVLTAMQPGLKELPPVNAAYTVQVRQRAKRRGFGFFDDDFFDNFFSAARIEEHQTKSNTLKIKVEPLPESALSSDGIGSFDRFTIAIDKKEVGANEPVLITLELRGKGNFEQIATPKLNLPPGFKYYDSKNSISEDLSKNYRGGSKKFEYIVQATQQGEYNIPAQTFTSFDVITKQIRTLNSNPIKIIINKSENVSTTANQPQPEPENTKPQTDSPKTKFINDIHFIEEDTTIFQKPPTTIPLTIFLLMLLLSLFWYNKESLKLLLNRVNSQFKFKDKKQNFAPFKKGLNEFKKSNNIRDLHRFFLKLLAIKFNTKNECINEDWIEKTLQTQNLPPEKISQFLDFLSTCASFCFATRHDDNFDYNELFNKADYWLSLILNLKN